MPLHPLRSYSAGKVLSVMELLQPRELTPEAKKKYKTINYVQGLLAMTLYAIAFNAFMQPLNLFSGGLLGISQIIFTAIQKIFGFTSDYNISGVVNLFGNIPLFIIAFRFLRRSFAIKSILNTTYLSILLTLIKIPEKFIPLPNDPLASCLVGGLLCGYATGMALSSGGSSGGLDILGMYLTQKRSVGSIGKVSAGINSCTFIMSFILTGNITITMYSLLFSVTSSLVTDRFHAQNIKNEVLIFTKRKDDVLQQAIMSELRRGVTYWDGVGAYTGEPCRCIVVICSKYEFQQLRTIVKKTDPQAFLIVHDKVTVPRAFQKRL